MNTSLRAYEICIAEMLEEHWREWFPDLEITRVEDYTLLRGQLPDQTALFGVLARIRDLNLTLISVQSQQI